MDIKIKNSQDIGFLNKDKIDLNSIKDKLIKAKGIDENLYINITENIEQVIGNQEIQWISRNNPDNLVNYLIYRFKFKICSQGFFSSAVVNFSGNFGKIISHFPVNNKIHFIARLVLLLGFTSMGT